MRRAVHATIESLESRTLLSSSTYTGHVFVNDNGGTEYNSEDRSLSGWTVVFSSGEGVHQVQTDSSGSFSFTIPDYQDSDGYWFSYCGQLELVMDGHKDYIATFPTGGPDPTIGGLFGGGTDENFIVKPFNRS